MITPDNWNGRYILDDDHNPVPCLDLMKWGLWFEDTERRRVARTDVGPGVYVSTVFLGVDHNYFGKGPPILFETMVFTDYGGDETWRYCTWNEAVIGHADIVARLHLQADSKADG